MPGFWLCLGALPTSGALRSRRISATWMKSARG